MLQTQFTCIPNEDKIHKTNVQISTATSSAATITVKLLYKLALHKIPLDGAFVHMNIY